MSHSYIPEETYAVCTYQMGGSPQKFIASRSKVSTFHGNKLPLLTIDDKNLNKQFICKSPVHFAAALLAFGAGLALVVTGPIGWTIAGAALIGGAIFVVNAITHKCTSPMKAGQWILFHPNVSFNSHNAITDISMLSCSSGGILKPFFSYSLACNAAKKIRNNNYAEVGVNFVISFFAGYLGPSAISGLTSKKAVGIFGLTGFAGLGVTWTIQYGQREYMRNNGDFENNSIYQNMNAIDENGFLNAIDDPSDPNDLSSVIPITETADGIRITTFIHQMIKEGKVVVRNNQINQMLAQFDGMTTAQLKNSDAYKLFLRDVQKGVYGPELRQSMINISGKLKPISSSVKKGMRHSFNKFNSSFRSMAKAGGIGGLFFLPFLGTYFSENARRAFGEEAFKDMKNGTNVMGQKPLGL